MPNDDYNFSNKREHDRKSLLADAKLMLESKQASCTVRDISIGGAKIETNCKLESKQSVKLQVEDIGEFVALVAWSRKNYLGLKFTGDQEDIGEKIMAIAMYG